MNIINKSIELADGRGIKIENGKLAKKAAGSGVVKMGGPHLRANVQAASGEQELRAFLKSTVYAEAADALDISQSEFDRWCDNRAIEAIKPQKYNPFSAGPIAAYALARENEIKTVRIILSGKRVGMPEASIRERIREMYV